MKRKRLSRRRDRKVFSRTARKVKTRNLGTVMRGGRRI